MKNWSEESKIQWSKGYEIPPRKIQREQRYEVIKRQNWKCNICGESLFFGKNHKERSNWEGKVAHIDHIIPYSKMYFYPRGYVNINETINLQALCPECNLKKKDKEVN